MHINFNFNLIQIFILPNSFSYWLVLSLAVAYAIFIEKGVRVMPRRSYLASILLRIIIVLACMTFLSIFAISYANVESADTGTPFPDSLTETLSVTSNIVAAICGFIMTRPVLWRLHDADLDPRFAYLLIVPVINTLMTIGLIFYPPSKNREPAAAA